MLGSVPGAGVLWASGEQSSWGDRTPVAKERSEEMPLGRKPAGSPSPGPLPSTPQQKPGALQQDSLGPEKSAWIDLTLAGWGTLSTGLHPGARAYQLHPFSWNPPFLGSMKKRRSSVCPWQSLRKGRRRLLICPQVPSPQGGLRLGDED